MNEIDKKNILIVDDDREILNFIKIIINKDKNYNLYLFSSTADALNFIDKEKNKLDLICTDLYMPEMNGFEFIEECKKRGAQSPIIIITGNSDIKNAIKAIQTGAFDYIMKPIQKDNMLIAIERALNYSNLEKTNKKYVSLLEKINQKNNKELSLARKIQKYMLPRDIPKLNNFKIGYKYAPSNKISGDFFDFLYFREENILGLYFLDVSGHGIPAALLTMILKSEIRWSVRRPINLSRDIESLNERLNLLMPEGNFVSIFFMLIYDAEKKIEYCQCSQEPALIFKNNQEIIELNSNGSILGCFDKEMLGEDFKFEVKSMNLEKNDKIVFFSDGITECMNQQKEIYSFERLKDFIRNNLDKDSRTLCDMVYEEVKQFRESDIFEDDFTILILDVE